jgi:hypothetical protein
LQLLYEQLLKKLLDLAKLFKTGDDTTEKISEEDNFTEIPLEVNTNICLILKDAIDMQSYLITLLMFAPGGQREQVILGITLKVNLHPYLNINTSRILNTLLLTNNGSLD